MLQLRRPSKILALNHVLCACDYGKSVNHLSPSPPHPNKKKCGWILPFEVLVEILKWRVAKIDGQLWRPQRIYYICIFMHTLELHLSGLEFLLVMLKWKDRWTTLKATQDSVHFLSSLWASITVAFSCVPLSLIFLDWSLACNARRAVVGVRAKGRPPPETPKLNFDGCSLGNPGQSGIVGMIRDHCSIALELSISLLDQE